MGTHIFGTAGEVGGQSLKPMSTVLVQGQGSEDGWSMLVFACLAFQQQMNI